MRIRVTRVPPGNEPIRLWMAMIDLELPVLASLLHVQMVKPRPGYSDPLAIHPLEIAVATRKVIPFLLERDEAVAQWCRKRIREIPILVLDIGSVEFLP